MRKIVINLFLPALAVIGIAFFMAFPQPADTSLATMISDLHGPSTPDSESSSSYVRTLIEAHAKSTPALEPALVKVYGCLEDLADASDEERQVCAPIVLDALRAIALAERGKGQFNLPDPNPGVQTIRSQIAVAAIDLCRNEWLDQRNPEQVPPTPICAAANVQLVMAQQKQ